MIYFLLIGLAAGWLGAQVMGAGNAGILGMLLMGVVGAYLGGFLIRVLGFSAKTVVAELITATIGAIVLIWLLRQIAG